MKKLYIIIAGLFSMSLSGCSFTPGNLDEFVKDESQIVKETLKVPEVKSFKPVAFIGVEKQIDPFAESNITKNNNIVVKDNREKGFLENYRLEDLKLNGSFTKNGEKIAILQLPDKKIHLAKLEEYIGENEGKITDILDNKIIIKEIVEDKNGSLQERVVELGIYYEEKSKSKNK